ncbi:MAG: tail fiber domain-containing protein [Leptospiraceae bacterium]|nr:tail fiber domain-containing protein [Leptospiraceae bacterium]
MKIKRIFQSTVSAKQIKSSDTESAKTFSRLSTRISIFFPIISPESDPSVGRLRVLYTCIFLLFTTSLTAAPVTGTIKTWAANDKLSAADLNQAITSLKTGIESVPNWTKSGSNAYFTGGNVGIGTTSPVDNVHVYGATNSVIRSQSASNSGYSLAKFLSPTQEYHIGTGGSGTVDSENFYIYRQGDALPAFNINKNSNIGIGTRNPQTPLHIYKSSGASEIQIDSIDTDNSNINFITKYSGSSIYNSASQGWQISARGNSYTATSERNNLGFFYWNGTGWKTNLVLKNDGNIGVGTAYPGSKLHIYEEADLISGLTIQTNPTVNRPSEIRLITKSVTPGQAGFGDPNTFGWYITARSNNETDSNLKNALHQYYFNGSTLNGFLSHFPANGNSVFGDVIPTSRVHIYDNRISSGAILTLQDTNSTCTLSADSGAPTCSSDAKLKKNISKINHNNSLKGILNLNPVTYHWKTQKDSEEKSLGFIAQEVETQFPELVSEIEGAGHKGLNMGLMMPHVIASIQEIHGYGEELSSKLTILEQENSVVQKELSKFKTEGEKTNSHLRKSEKRIIGLEQENQSLKAELSQLKKDNEAIKQQNKAMQLTFEARLKRLEGMNYAKK